MNLFNYLDKDLDESNRADFEKHIEMCRHCFDRVDFEKSLRNKIREKVSKCEVSQGLINRVKNMMNKFDKP